MYDVLILGGGPAGLTAALYAARASLSVLVIEGETIGGQISQTNDVENYPGNIENLSGIELSDNMKKQAESFGAEFKFDRIIDKDITGDVKVLKSKRNTYEGKSLIIATGAAPRHLNVPGEDEFIGRGVGYCGTCDAPFYRGLDVYVSGGGDSAIEEAMFLAKFARKVTILVRGDKLKAQPIIIERMHKTSNIEILYKHEIVEIKGDTEVKSIVVKDTLNDETKEFDDDNQAIGVFVFVGRIPNTDLFKDTLELDRGYIVADENMHTNIDGVCVAGDVRVKKLRQVVTATGDGAIAAEEIVKYVGELDD